MFSINDSMFSIIQFPMQSTYLAAHETSLRSLCYIPYFPFFIKLTPLASGPAIIAIAPKRKTDPANIAIEAE